ncbi:hypothetical protein ACO0QE_001999 [Hanseniaspora vineae]
MSNEQSILVKVKGYPSWPALVIPPEKIPKRLLEAKSTSPENHYCVKFYNDNDYTWLKKSRTMSLAKQYDLLDSAEKITALIDKEASKRKKNDKLIKAYQMVLEQVSGVFPVDEFINAGEEKYIQEPSEAQDFKQEQLQQDSGSDKKVGEDETELDKKAANAETDKKKKKPAASKKRSIKQENEDQPVKKQDTKGKKQPAKKAAPPVKKELSKEATPKLSKRASTPTATKKNSTKKTATPAPAEKKSSSKQTFKFESPLVDNTNIPIYELVNRGPQHLDLLKVTPSNCGVAYLPNFAALNEKKFDLQDSMQTLKNLLFDFFTEYITMKKNDKDVKSIMTEPDLVEKSNVIFAEFENLANNKSLNYFKYLFLQDQEFYHYFNTYMNVLKSTKSSDSNAEQLELNTLFEKLYVK